MDRRAISLNASDKKLIDEAKSFLSSYYRLGQHHVVSVFLSETGKKYFGLHIDSKGDDVCAETSALVNSIIDGARIRLIVSVIKKNGKFKIINPCGQCRQLLGKYVPKAESIIETKKGIRKMKIEDLLPFDNN